MSQDYSRTVSLKLSDTLNDIGVNERMVLKRRKMVLLGDGMVTTNGRLLGINSPSFRFGSMSEGSTTIGLQSDSDTLQCVNICNVIQDWSEWHPGMYNLLMIQGGTVSPGYCILQCLRDDAPLPVPMCLPDHEPNSHLIASGGKVLLMNTVLKRVFRADREINGPAISIQGRPGLADIDCVQAYHCKSWPVEARPWLVRQGIGRWPSEDMKRYCESTGCLVVPASSKSGLNEELEWRISTSQAERSLMFSLNITQIRCYILMKMILKTFINPQCDGVLSSFMCKTVLFHCIHNIHSNSWQPTTLLPYLICCLLTLHYFVRQENCPHFIIPENNLMAGRISPHNKHKILKILQNVIQNEGRALLEIPIDDLGTRLQMKMNMGEVFQNYKTPADVHECISAILLHDITTLFSYCHKLILRELMKDGKEMVREKLSGCLFTLTKTYRQMVLNRFEKSAIELLTLPLSSSLGSVLASHDIYTTGSISTEALAWFTVGLNSDLSSGRLKLASALYCAGDMGRAEFVLRNTEEKYDLNTVVPVCGCYDHPLYQPKPAFMNTCNNGNEELMKHITAFCVRFLLCEINCVPKELQYEMFRSTQEDMLQTEEEKDSWMDMAVVDSLPYLYFLQYKTYGALQRLAGQQCALSDLATTIDTEQNLAHRETALNLLGQCMERENRNNDALSCYMKSLKIRTRNNAAKILICRLLNALVNV